jgi:hypothetical protein
MQSKSTTAADLSGLFDSAEYAHAHRIAELVLERLPSGEFAYLKPPDDDARFTITYAGRRALRMAELFDAEQ